MNIFRDLVYHPTFADPVAFKIWVWCMSMAVPEATTVSINVGGGFKVVPLEANQFVFSRREASKELDIPHATIQRWIDRFATEKMGFLLEKKVSHLQTIITMRVTDLFWDVSEPAASHLYRADSQRETGGFEGGGEPAVSHLNHVPDNQTVSEKAKKADDKIDYNAFVDFFNSKTNGIFGNVRKPLSDKRKGNIRVLVRAYGKKSLVEVLEKTMKSDFLIGKNVKNWMPTFDWIINRNNFDKILTGNYDNKKELNEQGNNVVSI